MKRFLHLLSSPGPSPLFFLILFCMYLLLQDVELSVANQIILGSLIGLVAYRAEKQIQAWSSK